MIQWPTSAERFKLASFEITAEVLQEKPNVAENMKPHPIQRTFTSPDSAEYAPTAQITNGSSLTVNPPASSFGQLQFTTSTCRALMGTSVAGKKQDHNVDFDGVSGTICERAVTDLGHKTRGGFLGTFVSSCRDCHPDDGCASDGPTTLSVYVKTRLVDTNPSALSRTVKHTLAILR